ncbi:MAG: tetratricopeptide repeat protein [Mariprofundaceae bacterium]|nr:tetratricopeptide repeat protein [Mariprofundaceae bacterium]
MALPVAVSFAALCLLSGCVNSDKNTIHWQQDRDLVVNSLQQLRSSEANAEGQLTQINQRITALQNNIQMQQGQIGALKARLNIQAGHLQELKNSMQPAPVMSVKPVPLPTKTNKKDSSRTDTAVKASLAKSVPLVTGINSEVIILPRRATTTEEKNSYTAAYLAYKSKRFKDAVQSFQRLLAQYPDGEYANPGYYWLAESLLAQKEYAKALEIFIFYTTHYPKSGKLAAAMLGTARAHLALQDAPSATAVLHQLTTSFPNSTAAEQGQKLLATITTPANKPS